MADHLPSPTRSSASWPRLAVLLALVAVTGLLLGLASGPILSRPTHRPRQAADIILCGDLLYRAGEFVQQQSRLHPGVAWYAGYLLSQRGLGIWERQALRPGPDPDALLRMGIIYSRSGYVERGRDALQAAGVADQEHYALYWGLIRLYAGEHQRAEELRELPVWLVEHPRWVGDLVEVDLQSRLGTPETAAAARATWEAHLNRFGLVLVLLELILAAFALAGTGLALAGLVRRLFTLRPRRWQAPLRVPWGLWEVTEVFTVAVFLLVAVSVGRSLLLQGWTVSGTGAALLMLGTYVLYMGAATAMAWRQAAKRSRPARLLGLRLRPAGGLVLPAVRTYAWLVFLLTPLGLYASHHYLASTSVFLRAYDPPAAFVVYFLLICVVAPVLEEIVFRGFLYGGLRQLFAPGGAAALSAIAFTGAHLPTPGVGAVLVVVLGFALALLYERTRSIVPGILLHALHNTLIFALMVAVMVL